MFYLDQKGGGTLPRTMDVRLSSKTEVLVDVRNLQLFIVSTLKESILNSSVESKELLELQEEPTHLNSPQQRLEATRLRMNIWAEELQPVEPVSAELSGPDYRQPLWTDV